MSGHVDFRSFAGEPKIMNHLVVCCPPTVHKNKSVMLRRDINDIATRQNDVDKASR